MRRSPTRRDSHGWPRMQKGDRMGCICKDCGDRYTHIEKTEQDPPRSTMRCPECYAVNNALTSSGARVAGTWRIRDEAIREELCAAIENNTPYTTYVEDRVGDVHVYDPEKLMETL